MTDPISALIAEGQRAAPAADGSLMRRLTDVLLLVDHERRVLYTERDDLAAIVRDIAARQPSDYEGYACGMCRTPDAMSRPEDHRDDCTWRRSVEWVKAHPAAMNDDHATTTRGGN